MTMVEKRLDSKRNSSQSQLSGGHTAESWNDAHPVGTAVRYWSVYPPIESAPPFDTVTRSEAWTLGDGETVVVLVAGKTGGVYLSNVEVLSVEAVKRLRKARSALKSAVSEYESARSWYHECVAPECELSCYDEDTEKTRSYEEVMDDVSIAYAIAEYRRSINKDESE